MSPMHLKPNNYLEISLAEAQAGKILMGDFIQIMVAADLFIASTEEMPIGAHALHPLLFDRAGVPMAAVYTDASRLVSVQSQVKSVVKMKGVDIFLKTPPKYGIVINPGYDIGLEILPEGVENIVNKYCGPNLQKSPR